MQYDRHLLYWARFLLLVGAVSSIWSPSELLLCMYVAFLGRSCSHATVTQYLKGLRSALATVMALSDWGSYSRLRRTLQGLKRATGVGQHAKLAIDPKMLVQFSKLVNSDRSGMLAVYTCMVIGFSVF
jgi:hypothetical protein